LNDEFKLSEKVILESMEFRNKLSDEKRERRFFFGIIY
jgi:hypothetical protein